ncbi:MAG: type I restriction enzyme HsdR N-terminal domain-containing protein, partial [Selenomonadaceae bacterium]|nr:type I restriction enzyme HsdR N-terminal domain-containing protein [Selenomonadaceae bacterium]
MGKKNLTEEDIKLRYITPAITAKWKVEHIFMEKKITDGRVNIKGNMAVREDPKRADYVLCYRGYYPLAIVEAKDNKQLPSFGLQQAKTYCQMMDVKFAYSSNGDEFVEFDFLTGQERSLPLADFPSEDELWERLEREGKLSAEDEDYVSIIPEEYRWPNWVHEEKQGDGLTGDDLLDFVNDMFKAFKELEVTSETPLKKSIVKTVFEDTNQ